MGGGRVPRLPSLGSGMNLTTFFKDKKNVALKNYFANFYKLNINLFINKSVWVV